MRGVNPTKMPSSIFDSAHRRLVELLKKARKKLAITQAELGSRVGKSQSFISMVERHQRRIDVVEFVALCRALNENPESVLSLLIAESEQ